jgi:RTA1 like protein
MLRLRIGEGIYIRAGVLHGNGARSIHQINRAKYYSHEPLTLFSFSSLCKFNYHLFEFTAKMPDSCSLQSINNCTVGTCPLSCAQVEYLPTIAGNAVYAATFGLLLIAQLGLGIKYKTWGFMVGMICGLILEVVGYAGRIMLHDNPFNFNNFIM